MLSFLISALAVTAQVSITPMPSKDFIKTWTGIFTNPTAVECAAGPLRDCVFYCSSKLNSFVSTSTDLYAITFVSAHAGVALPSNPECTCNGPAFHFESFAAFSQIDLNHIAIEVKKDKLEIVSRVVVVENGLEVVKDSCKVVLDKATQ
jgi:hypothetical protein